MNRRAKATFGAVVLQGGQLGEAKKWPPLDEPRSLTTFRSGRPVTLSMRPSDFGQPQLAAELADAWISASNGVNASARSARSAVRALLAHLADEAPEVGSASDLTVAHIDGWENAAGTRSEFEVCDRTFPILRELVECGRAELSPRTYERAKAGINRRRPSRGSGLPEFDAAWLVVLQRHLQATVREVTARCGHARRKAADGSLAGWMFDHALRGALTPASLAAHLEWPAGAAVSNSRALASELADALEGDSHFDGVALTPSTTQVLALRRLTAWAYRNVFPTREEAYGFLLAVAVSSGDSFDLLTTIDPKSVQRDGQTVTCDAVKARAGKRYRGRTYLAAKPYDAGTLIAQFRDLIQPLTAIIDSHPGAGLAGRLWVGVIRATSDMRIPGTAIAITNWEKTLGQWLDHVGLDRPPAGAADARRIRSTVKARTILANIDAGESALAAATDHTAQVMMSQYASQGSVMRRAAEASLATQERIAGLTRAAIVADGEVPTEATEFGVGACLDPSSPPKELTIGSGDWCNVAPLMCFACDNCVLTPSHAPAVRYTLQLLTERASHLPPPVAEAEFGPIIRLGRDALRQLTGSDSLDGDVEPVYVPIHLLGEQL